MLKAHPPRIRTADRRVAVPAKRADPFYLSPGWRKLMGMLIAQRGRCCEQCGRTQMRVFGDHVRELRDGGAPLDPANIRLLCGSCHTAKTLAERARRMAEGT